MYITLVTTKLAPFVMYGSWYRHVRLTAQDILRSSHGSQMAWTYTARVNLYIIHVITVRSEDWSSHLTAPTVPTYLRSYYENISRLRSHKQLSSSPSFVCIGFEYSSSIGSLLIFLFLTDFCFLCFVLNSMKHRMFYFIIWKVYLVSHINILNMISFPYIFKRK